MDPVFDHLILGTIIGAAYVIIVRARLNAAVARSEIAAADARRLTRALVVVYFIPSALILGVGAIDPRIGPPCTMPGRFGTTAEIVSSTCQVLFALLIGWWLLFAGGAELLSRSGMLLGLRRRPLSVRLIRVGGIGLALFGAVGPFLAPMYDYPGCRPYTAPSTG